MTYLRRGVPFKARGSGNYALPCIVNKYVINCLLNCIKLSF